MTARAYFFGEAYPHLGGGHAMWTPNGDTPRHYSSGNWTDGNGLIPWSYRAVCAALDAVQLGAFAVHYGENWLGGTWTMLVFFDHSDFGAFFFSERLTAPKAAAMAKTEFPFVWARATTGLLAAML